MLLVNNKEKLYALVKKKRDLIQKKHDILQKQNEIIQKKFDFLQKQKYTNTNIIQRSIFFKDMSFNKDVIFDSKNIHLYSSSSSIIKHPTENNFLLCAIFFISYR